MRGLFLIYISFHFIFYYSLSPPLSDSLKNKEPARCLLPVRMDIVCMQSTLLQSTLIHSRCYRARVPTWKILAANRGFYHILLHCIHLWRIHIYTRLWFHCKDVSNVYTLARWVAYILPILVPKAKPIHTCVRCPHGCGQVWVQTDAKIPMS